MKTLPPLLQSLGFSTPEIATYLAGVSHGPQTVTDLSAHAELSRQGIYDALALLEERGLVTTVAQGKKRLWSMQPPSTLLAHVRQHRAEREERERELEALLPSLQLEYQRHTERPIVRFFEGTEGLKKMYEDKLASGAKESHFVRTADSTAYWETFGPWITQYLKRQSYRMRTHVLSVDDVETNHDPAFDAVRKITRTWLRPQDYTAPVHIDAYGDRVGILSFGTEIFGIIIESAPIATAIRELFTLAERGAKTIPVLHDHPPIKWQRRA